MQRLMRISLSRTDYRGQARSEHSPERDWTLTVPATSAAPCETATLSAGRLPEVRRELRVHAKI
jgi:hypothetical protein